MAKQQAELVVLGSDGESLDSGFIGDCATFQGIQGGKAEGRKYAMWRAGDPYTLEQNCGVHQILSLRDSFQLYK